MTKEEMKLIKETEQVIILNKNKPDGMKLIKEQMNKMYSFFKQTIQFGVFSDKRLIEIFKLERLLENKFLPLNSEPIFDLEITPKLPTNINNETDCENIMQYIVHESRKQLNKHFDLKTATLESYCINSSSDVDLICNKLGIKHKTFHCSETLSPGTFHCFNIITLRLPDGIEKNYLVDCTYRQFFTYAESFLDRIGLPLNNGANIGVYMMMDEARKRMAEEILVKGYVELTPENIKYYFDGFVFSGRNGFYYEQLNKSVIEKNDYEPHYTFEDYIYALYNGGLKDEKYIERQKTKLNIQMSFSEHDKQKKLN